jgi:hypothetical protein
VPVKKVVLQIFLMAGVLANLACSNQWRESDPGVDSAYAMELFDEISASNAWRSQNYDPSALLETSQDPYSTLYFAESGPAMGAVPSIFAFSDASFADPQNIPSFTTVFDMMAQGLNKVSVLFLDGYNANQERYFTLMLKLEASMGTTYFIAQSSNYSLDDKEFWTEMQLSDGRTLVLRSYDISQQVDGELAGTIQLKAFIDEGSGEYQIGQFSVLHGFGGQP